MVPGGGVGCLDGAVLAFDAFDDAVVVDWGWGLLEGNSLSAPSIKRRSHLVGVVELAVAAVAVLADAWTDVVGIERSKPGRADPLQCDLEGGGDCFLRVSDNFCG